MHRVQHSPHSNQGLPRSESPRTHHLLKVAAIFAMAWVIARALIQAVSIDEAVTYTMFVYIHEFFYPLANNHILNTLLIGLFTSLFDTSNLTVRLGARVSTLPTHDGIVDSPTRTFCVPGVQPIHS